MTPLLCCAVLCCAFLVPAPQVQVSSAGLTALGVQHGGGVLGCGASDGSVAVVALSASLAEAGPSEKVGVNALLEREALR